MGHEDRSPTFAALKQLAQRAPRSGFFQLVAQLQRLYRDAVPLGHDGPTVREALRIRPSWKLGPPPNDVESLDVDQERPEVVATFMGLYGIDSPLPSSYVEEIAQEADVVEGERVRGLLDIFHHRIYSLLFRVWAKLMPEVSADSVAQLVGNFSGEETAAHGAQQTTRRRHCLGTARLGVLQHRSGLGLQAYLKIRLRIDVTLLPLRPRTVALPRRSGGGRATGGLGNARLGSDTLVGENLTDRGKFALQMHATDIDAWRDLVPGGRLRRALEQAVVDYLRLHPDYDLHVTLPAAQAKACILGKSGLGRDSWLGQPRENVVWDWLVGPAG